MSVPAGAAAMPAAGTACFDLRFRLDWQDYGQAMRGAAYTFPQWLNLIVFHAGLFALGSLLGALCWWSLHVQLALASGRTALGLSISIGATALLLSWHWALWPLCFRSACRDLVTTRGECHLVADEQGLTQTVVGIVLFAPWQAIQQVRETRAHVVLSYARRSQFVVPKRSFKDAVQGANFLTFARARQAQSS